MKRTTLIKALLFLSISFFTYSCYYDKEEQLYPVIDTNCDTSNVTYKNTISTMMASNCTSCHGANAVANGYKIDLTSYASIKANIDKIVNAIDHQPGFPPMPPTGAKMDACKIAQIKLWQTAGALNN